MRRILGRIKYKIGRWFYFNFPIYIGTLNIFRPFSTWFKVRKYFKMPHITFKCGNINNVYSHSLYNDRYEKSPNFILFFNNTDVEWKYKLSGITFECEPTAVLVLFNKWKFVWALEAPSIKPKNKYRDNNGYWEAIIECAYNYNKDIVKTKEDFSWKETIKDENGLSLKDENGSFIWTSTWDDNWLTKYSKKITKHINKNDEPNNRFA